MMSLKRRDLLSLFSIFLVAGCITVPRIQRKDARNNQFSAQLQNWIYLAHPPNIDTTVQEVEGDTIMNEHDTIIYRNNIDSIGYITTYPLEVTIPMTGNIIFDSDKHTCDTAFWYHPKIINKVIIKTITRTIRDTIRYTVVDMSAINAYQNQLKASRDSLTNYQILYANQKSKSLNRLIWIIGLSLTLGLSLYICFKQI